MCPIDRDKTSIPTTLICQHLKIPDTHVTLPHKFGNLWCLSTSFLQDLFLAQKLVYSLPEWWCLLKIHSHVNTEWSLSSLINTMIICSFGQNELTYFTSHNLSVQEAKSGTKGKKLKQKLGKNTAQ